MATQYFQIDVDCHGKQRKWFNTSEDGYKGHYRETLSPSGSPRHQAPSPSLLILPWVRIPRLRIQDQDCPTGCAKAPPSSGNVLLSSSTAGRSGSQASGPRAVWCYRVGLGHGQVSHCSRQGQPGAMASGTITQDFLLLSLGIFVMSTTCFSS